MLIIKNVSTILQLKIQFKSRKKKSGCEINIELTKRELQ